MILCRLLFFALAFATLGFATVITVNINTTGLISLPRAYLDFQLVDGDGVANSSVQIEFLDFGGGSSGSDLTLSGAATGSVASGFSLSDGQFFNGVLQDFFPGNRVQFGVTYTELGSGIPDYFTLAILDENLGAFPTTGFLNELLGIELVPSYPANVFVYGTNDVLSPVSIPAPTITGATAGVPEPLSAPLTGLGVFALLLTARRRSSKQ